MMNPAQMKYLSNSAKETRKECDFISAKTLTEVGEGISSFVLSEHSHATSQSSKKSGEKKKKMSNNEKNAEKRKFFLNKESGSCGKKSKGSKGNKGSKMGSSSDNS